VLRVAVGVVYALYYRVVVVMAASMYVQAGMSYSRADGAQRKCLKKS
jgi:hypothetical protein